jgi:hypothetical protein
MVASTWATILTFIAASSAFAAKEVEFKHHNNTELAETLQKVHNRYVLKFSFFVVFLSFFFANF